MATIMMTQERRYILMAGCVLLLLGLMYRFYPDVIDFLPDSGELDMKIKTVERYKEKVGERRQIQERIMTLARRLEQAESVFLEGATPALAAVSIQNVVNEIAQSNGLEMASQLVMKTRDDPEKPYLEIPVQITVRLSVAQLRDFLYKIDSSPQLLAILDLRLRRLETAGPDMLNATMTVAGYMKKSETEKTSKNKEKKMIR